MVNNMVGNREWYRTKKIEEWMKLNNVYIVSSIDGNGNHVGRLKGLYLDANDDLIISVDIDDLSCTTEETLGCAEKDCSYCKNGTYRKPIHQFDGTLIRRANFCDECGRDLRHL